MTTITEQLQHYRSAFFDAEANGDQAVARKIQQQIKDLEDFQQRHPDAIEAPSPFEVFCDLNPDNVNCRIFDD